MLFDQKPRSYGAYIQSAFPASIARSLLKQF